MERRCGRHDEICFNPVEIVRPIASRNVQGQNGREAWTQCGKVQRGAGNLELHLERVTVRQCVRSVGLCCRWTDFGSEEEFV